ncbi:MAG: hypothetical protein AB2806_15465 [Candidatus Thiodiazotropha sp.]
MIELLNNQLTFRFPEVHEKAVCSIDFQRTLRIPDDNREYPLPPGLGRFPVEHVDDFADQLPDSWRTHGGVFIPMYQSEALWINFSGDYPCAVKIAAGKINAVSGEPWSNGLSADSQDYAVIPEQPWLDGFNVSEDFIRQFVAMPLGEGFTAEEQITGTAEHGGLQIIVYPMKHDVYVEHFERTVQADMDYLDMPMFSRTVCESAAPDMGLAPGGLMRQEIYEDEYGIDAWDQDNGFRCFIHLANSEQYLAITGHQPPHTPPTANDYTSAGLPWFDYYSDGKALSGSETLGKLTSVAAKVIEKGKGLLPDNEPVHPKTVKIISKGNVVRDGEF